MDELRIVLLGKQGAGKSTSGNTLLRNHSFHTAASSERVTQACSVSMSTVDKQTIKVIDTPGWYDSSRFETDIKQEIINMSSPGPHTFLLVLPIGRFTNEEINTVMNILKEFGDEVTKYMIVLFTKGDDLEDRPIEDYLKELHSDLKKIIQICGGRYHVFNNRDKTDNLQVSSLLKKVNEMVKRNEEKFYTTAMYQKENDQQKDDTRRQQCRREKNNSVQDKSKNQSASQNGDRRNRCDAVKDREREDISEVRMERSQEQMTQQQISTQNRERERLNKLVTLERESKEWENGGEQRRRDMPGNDDKRRRRYSYDADDAKRRNVKENREISREINRLEEQIKKLHKSIKEKEALECTWVKERDRLKNKIHELETEVVNKKRELKKISTELNYKMYHNEQLKQQVKEQNDMFEQMEKLWAQQKTTDEKTKTRAILDFFQNLFR